MSRSVMTLGLGSSLPESLSLLHRRLLVAERQGVDLATKLGVSEGELDSELMDSSKPEALEMRVCRLESLLHTLRLSVFRVETERDLNSSHTERLQEQLAALQEQCEEEQRCSRRAVMRLRDQLQQEREEAQREAYTLQEQLHVSRSSRTDVFAAVDELKKIKVQLNQKLHQLKEEAAREMAARLEAERSHDALLRRVKELEGEVESEKEQVKRLQDNVHALKVDGQEVRAELEVKAELVQSLQEERQQLMERLDLGAELKALNDQLEAQCSDLSSALHSLTEEKTQLQAVLKKEQERTAERLKDMDLQLDAAKRNVQCEVQEALAARRLLNKELETLRLDHTKLQQSSAAALDAAVHHQELLERTIKRLRGELSNAVLLDLSSSQQEELQAERFRTHTLQEKCQISENLQEAHGWFRSKFASLKVGSGHSRASFPGRSGDFRNDGNKTAYGPSKVNDPDGAANDSDAMRQLKGKPKKESWKDKKERKEAMHKAREQVATVVLPTLAVLVLLIVLFVYVATRPGPGPVQ
ncbi:coiled-coil domain-containing protein 150 isoform X5 [Silurus asotus]|uniref:Coiled-coil domain-containing protein 150 isoform X5 n=1 Tax=Silurus asotus TaxID=30991 RepID=A0AAD5B196_SILAS|nr:coiled-coil domain-containing protein 150 isoform X5 [Silurus asotus]